MRILALPLLLVPLALAAQHPLLIRPASDGSPSTAGTKLGPILGSDTDDFINGVLKTWRAPGVAVAVVRMDEGGDWRVETKGYGIENHKGKKMTEDSLFSIASNTKLFTAISAGLLVHNKSVDLEWDTKMEDVVPGWGLMDDFASEQADLKDMLGHRSGLPRHDMLPKATDKIESIVSRLRHLRPSTEFRQKWQYNNHAYVVAAKLPYFLLPSRPSFGQYIQEHILGPLGMTSTTTDIVTARARDNMADGFTRTGVTVDRPLGDDHLRPMAFFLPDDAEDTNSGAGGVITSARDVAIWLQLLLLEGKHPKTNETVVPSEVIASVSEGVSVIKTKGAWKELGPSVYGAGSQMSSYRGHQMIEHGGSVPGFLTQIVRLPDEKAGVAVFVNEDVHGQAVYETIKFTLLDRILSESKIDWVGRYQKQVNETLRSQTPPTPRPSRDASTDLSHVAGRYHDPAYGTIELCLVSPDADQHTAESESCSALRSSAPVVLPGAIKQDVPTWIAHIDRLFTTHLRFEHFDGDTFNVTQIYSIPSIDKKETDYYPQGAFDDYSPIVAEFVRNEGLAISGGAWGAGAGVGPRKGETMKERAEIWFERA